MAIDTLMVDVGVYGDVADAEADYELVKDLHTEAGLIDGYDAAVIERREGGKTKVVKNHETPTNSSAASRGRGSSRAPKASVAACAPSAVTASEHGGQLGRRAIPSTCRCARTNAPADPNATRASGLGTISAGT